MLVFSKNNHALRVLLQYTKSGDGCAASVTEFSFLR